MSTSDDTMTPLEGEPALPGLTPPRQRGNKKALVGALLLVLSVLVVLCLVLYRYFAPMLRGAEKQAAVPDVASAQSSGFKMPETPRAASAPASAVAVGAVPGLTPLPKDKEAAAIGVRGNGQTGGATPRRIVDPDDAPLEFGGRSSGGSAPVPRQNPVAQPSPGMRTISTANGGNGGNHATDASASLEAYQKQLGGMMERLQALTDNATTGASAQPRQVASQAGSLPVSMTGPQSAGPFGMDRSASTTAYARRLPNPALMAMVGDFIPCALEVKIISAVSGFVKCIVPRNFYSRENVVLAEKGSVITGEFRIGTVRPGMTRIPVLGATLVTPLNIEVDLNSPATGPLGEGGVGGYVDNRWPERIGASLLLALTTDAVKYILASQDNNGGSNNTVVLSGTTEQGPKLAEKVLDSTINIPPLLYTNQGAEIGFYVARKLDFSGVYELRPAEAKP